MPGSVLLDPSIFFTTFSLTSILNSLFYDLHFASHPLEEARGGDGKLLERKDETINQLGYCSIIFSCCRR